MFLQQALFMTFLSFFIAFLSFAVPATAEPTASDPIAAYQSALDEFVFITGVAEGGRCVTADIEATKTTQRWMSKRVKKMAGKDLPAKEQQILDAYEKATPNYVNGFHEGLTICRGGRPDADAQSTIMARSRKATAQLEQATAALPSPEPASAKK